MRTPQDFGERHIGKRLRESRRETSVRVAARRMTKGGRRCRSLASLLALALLTFGAFAPTCVPSAPAEAADMFSAYRGLYQITPDHAVGIAAFIDDSGKPVMLFSDYRSGVVRRIFPVADDEFVMGPNFDGGLPSKLNVRFVKNERGLVSGIALQRPGMKQVIAARTPLTERDVGFQSDGARLAGTLIASPGKTPRPAIVLLHGSGPLTRYSFGPYPYFFASLGLSVLIYDKRGTGASTGVRLDASTSDLTLDRYYPDDLRADALAALAYLRTRREIDPERIGFWGSSEGGMLATQVAAHSPNVAFVIDSSGFMGPLWKTYLYQEGAQVKKAGGSDRDVEQATRFTSLWLGVARTGKGWQSFVKGREALRRSNPYWPIPYMDFKSLEEMQWFWKHVLTFNPLPDLARVSCPVLAVYGEHDVSTEASVAVSNLERAFAEAGRNEDVTVKIFPKAGHSLASDAGERMAPGVFSTLRSWLVTRGFGFVGRASERP